MGAKLKILPLCILLMAVFSIRRILRTPRDAYILRKHGPNQKFAPLRNLLDISTKNEDEGRVRWLGEYQMEKPRFNFCYWKAV